MGCTNGLEKTKPILPLRIADWGTDLPPPACAGRLRQTKPIPPRIETVKCLGGEELWLIGHACQTKPISGYAGSDEAGGTWDACAKQTQFRRADRAGPAGPQYKQSQFAAVQTNPIRGHGGRGEAGEARGDCAKQTQFLPFCRSGDRRSREGESCQSQFRVSRLGPEGDTCETKPNLGGMGHLSDGASGEANYAKQSQLSPVSGNGRGQ
jgi:hypothetical protein